MNVKLGSELPKELSSHRFLNVTPKTIQKLCRASSIPLVVKGVMTSEDAELAIESGAEGIVVSNHGGRVLDQGQASLDVLPEIVKHVKSKKTLRRAEVLFDGGIRWGTDILKALALGARGCLIGRPIFYGLAVNRDNGPSDIMEILKQELVRATALCGVSNLEKVDSNILRPARPSD
jgi:4-hydroxymandelate oxidase